MKTEHKYLLYGGLGLVGAITVFVLIKRARVKTFQDTAVLKAVNSKFAKTNQALLNSLNPQERATFIKFINDIEQMGYSVVVTSASRDTAKQVALKKENSKNATPCFSLHEYGVAIDINLVKNGKWINKDSPVADWIKSGVVDLAKKKYNMRWGGEFKGYHDPVHFDLGNKYDGNKLCKIAIKKFGSVDKIHGATMPLPT